MPRSCVLGGTIVSLLATEQGTLPPRATKDVDVAIEISGQMEYYELDKRLLALGFTNYMPGPICRYLNGFSTIDVMPVNPGALGSVNSWYPLALKTARQHTLPNEITIKLITPECFLGTKLVAFNAPNREDNGNIFTSRDFADIVRVMDGRPAIGNEVLAASDDLRAYLQDRFAALLEENYLEEAVAEHVDAGREGLVIGRIQSLVHSETP